MALSLDDDCWTNFYRTFKRGVTFLKLRNAMEHMVLPRKDQGPSRFDRLPPLILPIAADAFDDNI